MGSGPSPPQPPCICTHDAAVYGLAFFHGGRASCSFLLRTWGRAGILSCPFIHESPWREEALASKCRGTSLGHTCLTVQSLGDPCGPSPL